MTDQNGTTAAPRGPGLVVRLTDAERAAWHAAARSAGYGKTAAWVRAVVADRLAGGSPAPARVAGSTGAGLALEVSAALGRIGANVNQLSRAANVAARAGDASPVTAAAVEALRVEVSQLREDLREGKGRQ